MTQEQSYCAAWKSVASFLNIDSGYWIYLQTICSIRDQHYELGIINSMNDTVNLCEYSLVLWEAVSQPCNLLKKAITCAVPSFYLIETDDILLLHMKSYSQSQSTKRTRIMDKSSADGKQKIRLQTAHNIVLAVWLKKAKLTVAALLKLWLAILITFLGMDSQYKVWKKASLKRALTMTKIVGLDFIICSCLKLLYVYNWKFYFLVSTTKHYKFFFWFCFWKKNCN